MNTSNFPTYVVPIDNATSSDINEPIIIALAIMHLNLLPFSSNHLLITEHQTNLQITKIINVSNTKSTIKQNIIGGNNNH